ncbi:MAG TPA: DUF3566 domain-containing protein [Acidimicrobiia bacterium]|nr:DUF3566 domain-containing protein [Acidimicrobiia bacterium]
MTLTGATTRTAPRGKATTPGSRVRPFVPAPADDRQPDGVAAVERRRVQDLKLTSVARVSACFYLCGLVVAMVAAVVLWMVASVVGVVAELESFIDDLGFEGFQFLSGTLLWAGLLIGLAVTVILTVLTVVAAALYNLFADLVGGLEITLAPVVVDEPPATPVERNGNGRGNGNGNGVRHH